MNHARELNRDLACIQAQAPIIHNITNFVVMNSTANALLALGASPIMAHAPEEMAGIVAISRALVLNIGTLSHPWIESMHLALQAARDASLPVVLDPVGAGATPLRTDTALRLLDSRAITILRGNAAEIRALAHAQSETHGVDSHVDSDSALGAARDLQQRYGCVVVISGAVDHVVGPQGESRVHGGHPLMTRVTGMGCAASALVAAFAAVNADAAQAAEHAMIVMGVCGERAASQAQGPGSLQVAFLDALYQFASKGAVVPPS